MLQKIYSQIFPPTCLLCDTRADLNLDLCSNCYSMLPHNHHFCHLCALPLPMTTNTGCHQPLCGKCLTAKPVMSDSHVPFLYAAPVDFIVQQLKYHGSIKHGRLIGELLASSGSMQAKPDLLIPVPQHHDKYLHRGFNHANLIAQTAGRSLGIPVDSHFAVRKDARPSQSGLNAAERKKNMNGAFQISGDPAKRHIAIVDDVVTTGATTQALSKALLRAGCKRISIWAFARTE